MIEALSTLLSFLQLQRALALHRTETDRLVRAHFRPRRSGEALADYVDAAIRQLTLDDDSRETFLTRTFADTGDPDRFHSERYKTALTHARYKAASDRARERLHSWAPFAEAIGHRGALSVMASRLALHGETARVAVHVDIDLSEYTPEQIGRLTPEQIDARSRIRVCLYAKDPEAGTLELGAPEVPATEAARNIASMINARLDDSAVFQ